MTENEILDALRETMKESSTEEVDWDSVTTDASIESLGFDSLSILDLIYDIQQRFNVEFDAEELARTDSVGGLVGFLKQKLDEKTDT